MLAVDVRDLSIRYGKLEAVKGITLEIPPGEVLRVHRPERCRQIVNDSS